MVRLSPKGGGGYSYTFPHGDVSLNTVSFSGFRLREGVSFFSIFASMTGSILFAFCQCALNRLDGNMSSCSDRFRTKSRVALSAQIFFEETRGKGVV